MIGPMHIHTVFCRECGGWSTPYFMQITHHEGHICCEACDEIIALVQTQEAIVLEAGDHSDWVKTGGPPVCQHCGSVAPYGDARIQWLSVHHSRLHRWWWRVRRG